VKFVCENCKAKYQIGDDKVSGKTVRMKCRRCGHLILVSATVTESSVARHAPAEGAPLGSAVGSQPAPPPGARVAGSVSAESPVADDDEGASTVIMTAPAALRMATTRPATQGTARPAPPAPRPAGHPGGTAAMPAVAPIAPKTPAAPSGGQRPPPPKPSIPDRPINSPFVPAAAPSAPSVADLAQRSMSSAISAAARGTSNPVGPARSGFLSRGHLALAMSPDPTPAPSHLAPVPAAHSPSVAPPAGGVAGAFQRVAAAGATSGIRLETPGEDWYVGVGGVPIGPVRLSVVRVTVEQGAVDGESLVWREGFEEWLPLRNVPGLRAILDDPRRSANPTPPPEGPRASISSSSLPRVSSTIGHSTASHAPLGSNVPTPAPSHARVPTSASSPEITGSGALALGNVPTGGVSLGPAASATSAPVALPLSDASANLPLPAAFSAAPSLSSKPVSIAPPPPPASVAPPSREDRRKGMHPFAYAMIAMAAVFGGVAAWVLFIKQSPPPVVVVKTVTADPGLNSAPPPPPSTIAGEPAAPSASVAVDPRTGVPGPAAGGPKPTATASAKPGDAPPPNAESFGSGMSGPSSGPNSNAPGSAQGKLSEGEIQSVVSRNQPRVRRQCWQPALDARAANGPKSARVSTTINISASGSVSSVSASGSESGFPGLASCVGGSIKGWVFPASEGPSTVAVPFSFNAQ